MTGSARRRRPVVALEERGVFAADAVMVKVALALRAALREARVNGSALDPDLAAFLAAAQAAEQRHRARPVPHPVRGVEQPGSAAASSQGGSLSSEDAARLAGVSPRAVRKAAQRGRLAGRRVGGMWTFTPAAVTAWAATRKGQREDDDQGHGE